MTERLHFSKLLSTVALSFIALACTPNKSATSKVAIKMPGNSSQSLSNKLSQSVSAQASPWDEMCYLVNVTGGSITSKKKNSCEVRKGITTKFIAAGATVNLSIPQGLGYNLQLIGYQRTLATDPCPTINADSDLESLDQSKLKELALQNFDAEGEQTTVTINAAVPANNLQTQYALAASCSAAPAAVISVSDVSYNFGTLINGNSAVKTFTLTNTGSVTATTLVANGLAAPYSISGGTCVGNLAAAATCTVQVTFTPTATGTHSDGLDISFNDGIAAQSFSHTFSGTSVAPAALTVSDGPTYDYGLIANGGSSVKQFTISNTGGSNASSLVISGLAAPFSWSGGSYPGTGGDCTAALAAAASCVIEVQFSPTSTGIHSDTINVSYFDGAATQAPSRNVQGAGAAPALLTLSTGSYAFGLKAIGSATDYSFTLSNSGGVSATVLSGAALTAPFNWKGGTYPGTGGTCTNTLAAGANCALIVTYSPTASGAHAGTVSISYHNGAVPSQNVSSSLSGTGANPFTWTGNSGNNNFTTAANWLGGVVPSPSDTAHFTSACSGANCDVNLASAITVGGLKFYPTYTGTFTQGTFAITLGSGGFEIVGGTFVGGSANISVNGPVFINGGTMTFPSGVFSAEGFSKSNSPTINHNNGTAKLTTSPCASSTLATDDLRFYNLELAQNCSGYDFYIDASNTPTLFVDNDLILNAPGSSLMNFNGTTQVEVKGDLMVTDFDGGNSKIKMVGTGPQSISQTSGYLPNLELGTSTVNLSGTVGLRGNLSSSGGILAGDGASTMIFEPNYACGDTSLDVTASTFDTVIFDSTCSGERAFSLSGSGNILNNLHFATSGNSIKINGGNLYAYGDVYNDSAQMLGGSSVIIMTGANTQTISGFAGAKFPSIDVQKVGSFDQVNLSGDVGIAESFTQTGQGLINPSTSNVIFYALGASPQVQIPTSLNNVTFKRVTGSGSINLISTVKANGNLVLDGSAGPCIEINGQSLNGTDLYSSCESPTTGTSVVMFDSGSTHDWHITPSTYLPLAIDIANNSTLSLVSSATYLAQDIDLRTGSTLNLNGKLLNWTGTFQAETGSIINRSAGNFIAVGGGSFVDGGATNNP